MGTLARRDVFVDNNCSIHFMGDCRFLQEALWMEAGVLMVPLPPHYAELNQVEFVFDALVEQMKSTIARSRRFDPHEFKNEIINKLASFSHDGVKKIYKTCGYSA